MWRMVADDITAIDEETTECERMVADEGTTALEDDS